MRTMMVKKPTLTTMLYLLVTFPVLTLTSTAQFNSGSTGADGALDLTNVSCPNSLCEVQLPESGVLNYTTITIPGPETNNPVTLRIRGNSRNTPAIVLAQGAIKINGQLDLSSHGGPGFNGCFSVVAPIVGPGGFRSSQVGRGFGPGGGTPESPNGVWVGPLSLVPLVGGSGAFTHPGAGAGGGAVLLASSTSISVAGQIRANGFRGCEIVGVASGSGGAIRLVSNSINVNASGTFEACGGSGNCGVVRLEASSLTFAGHSNPPAVLASVNSATGTVDLPTLRIVSVGGTAVPSYAGSRYDTVDVLLPSQTQDPLPVVVQATNIPSGTQVSIGFVGGSPNGTSNPCNLTGGPGPLSCTATISNLNRTAVTYLLATATFDPPTALANSNPRVPGQVAKVRIESTFGGPTRYSFLDGSGREIDKAKISKELLAHFGN